MVIKKTKKKTKRKTKPKGPKLPPNFEPAKGTLLGKLMEHVKDEDKIPEILDLKGEDANLTMCDLEDKYTGIAKIGDEMRKRVLIGVERSLFNLAMGGVQTERRWESDGDSGKWVPTKQKDVLPHFEACKLILSMFDEDWNPNKLVPPLEAGGGLLGGKESADDLAKLEGFAGKLLEVCATERSVKLTIQEEVQRTDVHRSEPERGGPVHVEAESATGVQAVVLDVQPES